MKFKVVGISVSLIAVSLVIGACMKRKFDTSVSSSDTKSSIEGDFFSSMAYAQSSDSYEAVCFPAGVSDEDLYRKEYERVRDKNKTEIQQRSEVLAIKLNENKCLPGTLSYHLKDFTLCCFKKK